MQDVAVGVAAPDDWKVTSAQPASAAELDSGQALTTVWTVSVPADTRPGTYTLTSHVTARHGNQADETTSTFDVVVPALPPGGTSNLGDDTWLSATNGYGPVERNTSNGESKAGDGHVMSINGSKYTTGLGAHAPGEITFYVGRQCSNVTTDVGSTTRRARRAR